MSTPHKEFAPPEAGAPCPCGTGKTFGHCCDPLLKGERRAENAEQLMRSRYSAHVARNWEYLHRTCEETAKEPYVPETGQHGREWTRLVIHAHEAGIKPETAYVDFTAYYKEEEHEHALHEKAEFRKTDGAWIYTRAVREGPAPVKSAAPKVGRNDPCPCGSRKKYKQCCLK